MQLRNRGEDVRGDVGEEEEEVVTLLLGVMVVLLEILLLGFPCDW